MTALGSTRLVLVLLSTEANKSPHVEREVAYAAEHGTPILPVRIESLQLKPTLQYYLNAKHRYDIFERPDDRRYDDLTDTVKILLAGIGPGAATASTSRGRAHRSGGGTRRRSIATAST